MTAKIVNMSLSSKKSTAWQEGSKSTAITELRPRNTWHMAAQTNAPARLCSKMRPGLRIRHTVAQTNVLARLCSKMRPELRIWLPRTPTSNRKKSSLTRLVFHNVLINRFEKIGPITIEECNPIVDSIQQMIKTK